MPKLFVSFSSIGIPITNQQNPLTLTDDAFTQYTGTSPGQVAADSWLVVDSNKSLTQAITAATITTVTSTTGNITTVNATTGNITTVNATTANATTVNGGASGTAGTVNVFPATASKGKLAITSSNNTTDTTTSLVVAAQAAARTITVPDPGIASTQVYLQGVANVTVTSAQLLALNATPITIIAAPGANKAVVPRLVLMRIAGGTAYAGIAAGEDLVLKYTDASGAECSQQIETTGFLDQTSAQIRAAYTPVTNPAVLAPVANAAVVLHLLSGEIITGDQDLIVQVYYDVVPTNF